MKPSHFAVLLSAVIALTLAAPARGQTLGDPTAPIPGSAIFGDKVILLSASLEESIVRKRIAEAAPQTVFVIEPGARWRLTDTLRIPQQVWLVGFAPGRGGSHTFQKGFDGPLATVSSWVTLQGIYFDGNKKEFSGDGIVFVGTKIGARENILHRIEVANCAGDGLVFQKPTYFNKFEFCSFDRNDGYGIRYRAVPSHHTDNFFDCVHIGWNRRGGVAFEAVEASSVFQNCEFFHNGGAAFTQFQAVKKTPGNPRIRPTHFGSTDIVVRDSVIRNHAGPVWLNLAGQSFSIVFADCRLKHNAQPSTNDFYVKSGRSAGDVLGLADPVGVFHVEKGRLNLELRGGYCRVAKATPFFTTSPAATDGSYLLTSGAAQFGLIQGAIRAPSAYATILNTRLLADDVSIELKGGYGLDPITGNSIRYGPTRHPSLDGTAENHPTPPEPPRESGPKKSPAE